MDIWYIYSELPNAEVDSEVDYPEHQTDCLEKSVMDPGFFHEGCPQTNIQVQEKPMAAILLDIEMFRPGVTVPDWAQFHLPPLQKILSSESREPIWNILFCVVMDNLRVSVSSLSLALNLCGQ